PTLRAQLQETQIRVAALVQARSQIDQPLRSFDVRGQQVWRMVVDGEDVIGPLNRLAAPCTRTVDAGIVDDGLKRSGHVGLLSKGARLFNAGQIALERRSSAGDGAHRGLRAIAAATMQNDLVAERDQSLGGQLSEAISRAGDEDAGHADLAPLVAAL